MRRSAASPQSDETRSQSDARRILLLGHTGKMGHAIGKVFGETYEVIGKNSRDFDARDGASVRRVVEDAAPDLVINAVAFLGIDPCESDPQKAFAVNTLYPQALARLGRQHGFLLVHFSTDAVFNDEKGDAYDEDDTPAPVNVYGVTKYGGDCCVQAEAERYYIVRIPVLFGESLRNDQFVERMLSLASEGRSELRIAGDIVSSPSYSMDVARQVRRIVEGALPFGLYHAANDGVASLYDLMAEIVAALWLEVAILKASYRDFPHTGRKNAYTPLRSRKLERGRPWREAVREYCRQLEKAGSGYGRRLSDVRP